MLVHSQYNMNLQTLLFILVVSNDVVVFDVKCFEICLVSDVVCGKVIGIDFLEKNKPKELNFR